MKNATILLAVVAMLAGTAGATTWTGSGTGNDWGTSGNWDAGVPTASSVAQSYLAGELIEITGNAAALGINFYSTAHEVRMAAGTYTFQIDVNQDGYDNQIGYETDQNGNPTLFNQLGGAIDCNWKIFVGTSWADDDHYGHGKYVISGGSADIYGIYLGNTRPSTKGKGIFKVDGAGAASIDTYIFRMESDRSELQFAFGGGSDPIQQIDVDGSVLLDGTLDITGTADNDTYTIMTYSGTLTNNLDTVNLPTGWSIDYGDLDGGSIVVTVPEPATMCLLAVGGIGVLIRRRSRA